MLKSSLPRVVVRKTNKYIIAQFVESKEAQDFVIVAAISKELLNYGWPKEYSGSLKSIPAAYLTGFLLGRKIKKLRKETNSILDIGLHRSTKGSRIYAVVKGLVDCGIDIKCSNDMFPSQKRVEGEHLNKEINVGEIKNRIIEKW